MSSGYDVPWTKPLVRAKRGGHVLPVRDGEVAQNVGLKLYLRYPRLQHVAYADDAHNLSAVHDRNMPDAAHGHDARDICDAVPGTHLSYIDKLSSSAV